MPARRLIGRWRRFRATETGGDLHAETGHRAEGARREIPVRRTSTDDEHRHARTRDSPDGFDRCGADIGEIGSGALGHVR